MFLRFSRRRVGVLGAVLGAMLSQSPVALAGPALQVPDYYVGAGVRGGKGDATAAVLDSKFKIMNLGDLTVSTRPALLTGGYDTEWRLPLTVEGQKNEHGFAWFGGVGLSSARLWSET